MISPYSQGDKNFQEMSMARATNIFKNYDFFKDLTSNNEIIFSNTKFFEQKYKDKKILIIGGGPSTQKLIKSGYQETFNKYDYLWSANSFYLNETLKNIKMDLIMVMLQTKIKSPEFVKYMFKNRPLMGFELHNKWESQKVNYDKLFMMQTRFYGILGVCQRMIIFACYLGAKEVGFVGLDGLKSMKEGNHSFEKNKNDLPSISDEGVFQYQSDCFWNHVNKLYTDTKIINHGYQNNYHRNFLNRNIK